MTILSSLPMSSERKLPRYFLSDVIQAVKVQEGVLHSRRRDLISAVNRVAALLRDEPQRILLDLPMLRIQLDAITPAKENIAAKTWANIRSQFFAAIKVACLTEVADFRKTPLSLQWASLLSAQTQKRTKIGLSRFARYASARQVSPGEIDDGFLAEFIKALEERSLTRDPRNLHRMTAQLWNGLAESKAELGLRHLLVPSFKQAPKRVDWSSLPESFRDDVASYLKWCAVEDPFHPNARVRPLKHRTIRYLRDQVHAAATALLASGFPASNITTLSKLVEAHNLKQLLTYRINQTEKNENTFNRDLAKALVRMAHEWTNPNEAEKKELKRIASKVRGPLPGLTDKNKKLLRQFDDPEVLRKLDALPDLLWREVRLAKVLNFRDLANAQTAIALQFLIYTAIRMHNLSALEFGKHVYLANNEKGVSSLEISGVETKNGQALAFDLPLTLVEKLRYYRNEIVPGILGKKHHIIFIGMRGDHRSQSVISDHLVRIVRRRAGIEITPHVFRHLAAKRILDASPGDFETIRQLLSHRNMSTTANFYAGIDSRRAGRHHQNLIDSVRSKNNL